MNWFNVALVSYFFGALAIILDKYILSSKQVGSPPVYSFYIGLMGAATLIFAPFGFSVPPVIQIIISLVSGMFFTFGILALYFAINRSEASRVAPVVGASTPIFLFAFAYLFLGETLQWIEIIGIGLLIIGGLLISFDLPLNFKKQKFFGGFKFAILAGLLLAIAYSLFKVVYGDQLFLNGFIWTRLGSGLAIICFFLVPKWRRDIIASFKAFHQPKRQHYQAGSLLIVNKLIGGASSFLFNYALSLGSVTLVNALVSAQYVFVLVLAAGAAMFFPKIYSERLSFWDWAQKIAAIFIIAVGVYLVYAGSLSTGWINEIILTW